MYVVTSVVTHKLKSDNTALFLSFHIEDRYGSKMRILFVL